MRFLRSEGLLRTPACVVAITAATLLGCRESPRPGRPHDVTIAAGPHGGAFHNLATDVARQLNGTVTGVRLVAKPGGGSTVNVAAVDESIEDVAFARADVAYAAYSTGTPRRHVPHTRLRAIAVMHRSVLHVVVDARSRVASVADLRGARVVYGRTADDGEVAPVRFIDLLGAGLGIHEGELEASEATFDGAAEELATARADVGLLRAGYPLDALTRLASRVDIRLLEISPAVASRIRADYPFYKPTLIPPDTYPGQHEPIWTVGVDNLLVCQRDLDESIVYAITRALFESLPALAAANPIARQIDPELAPTTPIPLHSGAARYDRERELFR